jgi:malonate decarboxylase alpha subunit
MNAVMQFPEQADGWSRRRAKKAARLARLAPWMKGPVLETGAIVEALEALIEPGDVVALEGDNQKQADFLSRALVRVDPTKLHDLHLLISSVSRPEHLTLFERGIARKIDFAYAGPESVRLAQLPHAKTRPMAKVATTCEPTMSERTMRDESRATSVSPGRSTVSSCTPH